MAQGAPEGNQNATGNKGSNLNDRKKLAKLRGLVVDECIRMLEMPRVDMTDRDRELREDILKKLAPTVLPRLQEHTGLDGEDLKIFFDPAFNAKSHDNPSPKTEGDSKEPSKI